MSDEALIHTLPPPSALSRRSSAALAGSILRECRSECRSSAPANLAGDSVG